MAVQVWQVGDFLTKAREYAEKEFDGEEAHDWFRQVHALGQRAHARGDGVAVYVNNDLGHPEIGQWQVMSYGGPDSQLETRHKIWNSPTFTHGDDNAPITLPDIGGRINWRYQLTAIVPSYEQDGKANEFGTPGYSATPPQCEVKGCIYRKGHDVHVFPHRVENQQDGERLVVVQVKVTGGATEDEALAIVTNSVAAGLGNWQDSAGECGFGPEEPLGPDAYDKGIRVELADSAVI